MGEGKRYLANILDVSERRESGAFEERVRFNRQPRAAYSSHIHPWFSDPLERRRVGRLARSSQESGGIAERNTIRLITLINDILDIEKLESGKLDMEFQTIPFPTFWNVPTKRCGPLLNRTASS